MTSDDKLSRRSRSPSSKHRHSERRHRSRSPRKHKHRSSHGEERRETAKRRASHSPIDTTVNPYPRAFILPYRAQPLSKHDYESYMALFASYLDIQKQKILEELDEKERKGRWKSFINKWNKGELAEGWYDPEMKTKADATAAEYTAYDHDDHAQDTAHRINEESEDDYGPVLPSNARRSGPSAATFADLAERDDMRTQDRLDQRDQLRNDRKADRRQQKERMDEMVPRAEPGTRERQLEKKREKADSARAFSHAKGEAGDMAEVGDADLMGSGGGVDDVKRMRREEERKKTERQLKKEEILRARAAEREERMQGLKAREDKTMDMLKAMAKERFG